MNSFFDTFLSNIDFIIVGLVLCAGFFQKQYFKGFRLSKDDSYDSALKTLMLSAIVSIIYIVLIKDPEKPKNWSMYFLSYFAATSLYELIVNPFVDFIKSILPSATKGQ